MRRSPKIKSLCCQNIYSEKFFLLFLQFLITFNKQIYFISPMVDWIANDLSIEMGLMLDSGSNPDVILYLWLRDDQE